MLQSNILIIARDPGRMNSIVALLLQGPEKSAPTVHATGVEGGFSLVMILAFIVGFLVLAACAVWMVMRGAAGVAKTTAKEEDTK